MWSNINMIAPALFAVMVWVSVQGGDAKSNMYLESEMVVETETIIKRATTWLLNQRHKDDGSWGNDTHIVLLALRLANLSHNNSPTLSTELQLSIKQMELEIALILLRRHEADFSTSRLAQYTLALTAMCMDPRKFHGHNLIGVLQHHEYSTDYDFASSSLAVCSADSYVRRRQAQRLLDIVNVAQYHNVDTIATVIMALRCIGQQPLHRNIHRLVRKLSMDLFKRQRPDGSFGDLHTTAMAMQALEEVENESLENWNKSAAIIWLMNHQKSDGSFSNDIHATAEIILGIVPMSIVNIRRIDCKQNKLSNSANFYPHSNPDDDIILTENHSERSVYLSSPSTLANVELNVTVTTPAISSLPSSIPNLVTKTQREMVNISYTLWIGTNETHHIMVSAPKNGTFYAVMLLAAKMSPHFDFIASEWPNGHYVHTLAGLKEEPLSYHYWLLYRLLSPPDKSSPPGNQWVAPGGVDDLEVDEGEYYLFWYKKL